ncbi:MAG: Gfo/Idh/MocA family oxidoreductase [Bacteroidetes bacterium]|nr:Gfo/Idh/MocA family oxidoreductase [Bacteroidota bacterium]
MKTGKNINRRGFIKNAAIGIIGLPLLSNTYGIIAPSDKIRIAHIGMGNMGRAHLKWFSGFSDVETVALCDVDKIRLREKYKILQEINPNTRTDTYTDFRHILDRKDIDVITCATPDHWHALIAIMAFQSGKDVYGEKPLSYNVEEGQVMKKCMEHNNSIFQLGTQIHAGENYHRVVEIIQSGILGKIHTVRLWKTEGSPGLGFPPAEIPPDTLDWDMWLGPAPYEEYTPVRCFGSFRHFFDYSGGVFGDFWCHIADIVYMSLNPQGLYSIDTRGERPDDGIADTPRWIEADFKFKDLDLYWTTTPPPVPGAEEMYIGAHFEGTNGSLTCDYYTRKIRIGNEIIDEIPEVPKTITRSPGHQRNFLDAVKSREQPESNIAYVREMTLPMHLALISFRLKRKLKWNSLIEQFEGDNAANYLLSRAYRAPWFLPE